MKRSVYVKRMHTNERDMCPPPPPPLLSLTATHLNIACCVSVLCILLPPSPIAINRYAQRDFAVVVCNIDPRTIDQALVDIPEISSPTLFGSKRGLARLVQLDYIYGETYVIVFVLSFLL